MGFRNPMYLDIALLKNLADYYGIDVPIVKQVTERSSRASGKGVGLDKGLTAHLSSDKTVETTEAFNTDIRPVRLVNDVIDGLLENQDAIDLVENPDAPLIARSPIQIEADIAISSATEIGSILGKIMPMMLNRFAEGEAEPTPTQQDLAELALGSSPAGPQVYDLKMVDDSNDLRLVMILDPKNLVDERESEDLEGEFTVFGIIDRLLSDGAVMSLSRYVLPGMNRTMRRGFGQANFEDFVNKFQTSALGRPMNFDALNVTGPGAVIKPLAVY